MEEEDFGFELEHLLFKERKCRICGMTKNLIEDFYKIRKKSLPSSYSYECKSCTIWRVKRNKKKPRKTPESDYPDW
jgi:hypothetical protein